MTNTRSPGIFGIVLIYAVSAGAWVLLSDLLVDSLFGNAGQVMLVSTLKGWLFVGFTSLVLYLLLRRRWRESDQTADQPANHNLPPLRSLLRPIVLLVLLIAGITGGAIYYTFEQEKQTEAARLQAIATLKAQQISDWLNERLADAQVVQHSQSLSESYYRWREKGDAATFAQLRNHLSEYDKPDQISGLMLLDESGHPVWHTARLSGAFDAQQRTIFLNAARQGQAVRVGPYLDAGGHLHLDFVAPLHGKAGKGDHSGPIVILHTDSANYLPATMRVWPSPKASGEILLLRHEGEYVVYLSEGNNNPVPALRLRLPLSQQNLLAAQAINHPERLGQMLEGVDYRGIPSLGIAKPIPATNWILMVKLDRAEFYDTASRDAIWIALAGILAAFIAAAGLFLSRQRQQLLIADQLQQTQSERLRALRLLAAIAESSSDAIFALDADGRFILFNPATEQITGQTQAEVIGRDESALFPPEVAARQMADNRRVMESGITLNLQEEIPSIDGNRIFLTTKGPLHDGNGRVIGLYGISRDITERTRLEHELYERAASFRTLAEQIPAILYRASLDELSRTTYISPRVKELGYTPEEWLAQPDIWMQNLHPDDLPQVLASLEAFHREGGTLSLAYRLRTRAGAWRNFRDEAEILFDTAGQPLYLQGIMLDVTTREQAELELRAALGEAQRFRAALDHVTAYIYMKDRESRYVYANRPTLELFGCTLEKLIGAGDCQFFPPETAEHLLQLDLRVFAGETTAEEVDVSNDQGERRVYWEIKTPIYADAERKHIWGLCGISTDITARKQMEESLVEKTEELRRQNEELARFNQLTVGRELDMIKLKQQINALSQQLGQDPPYPLAFLDAAAGEYPERLAGGLDMQGKKS
jgi:PAS domain S-box-containing protein